MNSLTGRKAIAARWTSTVVLLLCLGFPPAAECTGVADPFSSLKEKLIREGSSPKQVYSLFRPAPQLSYKTVAATMRIHEGKLNYEQFLAPAAMARARRFLDSYDTLLTKAERTYSVDRRVIVAILHVETGFGSYTGKTPTLDILSTFALMDQKICRDKIWQLLTPKDRKHWGREAFDKKLQDRSKWACDELRALLQLQESHAARVHTLKGSVMGAVGWPQFLPSSLVRFGADGNNDGIIDLYEPADAIFSVANYLHGHGWTNGIDRTAQEEVIYSYNHSRPYIRTVLAVAYQLPR